MINDPQILVIAVIISVLLSLFALLTYTEQVDCRQCRLLGYRGLLKWKGLLSLHIREF